MAATTSQYGNIAGLNRALRKLPKEASVQLRDASVDIARDVAREAQSRARRVGGVARFVAPTIVPTRDRVPVIKMGSSALLPEPRGPNRKNQTVGNVIFGAEYGGGRSARTSQFQPWRGRTTGAGYFLWPAVRANNGDIRERYSQALLDAMQAI